MIFLTIPLGFARGFVTTQNRFSGRFWSRPRLQLDVISVGRIAVQQTPELAKIKMRRQQIPATQINDGAVLGLAVVVAIGFDHTHIFVLGRFAAAAGFDHAQEHRAPSQKSVPAIIPVCARDSQLNSIDMRREDCPYKIAPAHTRRPHYQILRLCRPHKKETWASVFLYAFDLTRR
jgi:hypothetical protein